MKEKKNPYAHYFSEVLGVRSALLPEQWDEVEVSPGGVVQEEGSRVSSPLLVLVDVLGEKESLLAQKIIVAMKWPTETSIRQVDQLKVEDLQQAESSHVIVLSEKLTEQVSAQLGQKTFYGDMKVLFSHGLNSVTEQEDESVANQVKRKMWEHFKGFDVFH